MMDEITAAAIARADAIEQYLFRHHGDYPLRILFAALLLIAAKIAHAEGMSNHEFRRIARDVYNAQKEEFDEKTG